MVIKEGQTLTAVVNGRKALVSQEILPERINREVYLRFGKFFSSTISAYQGEIDEVRFSKVAQKPEAIIKAYKARLRSHKEATDYFKSLSNQ